jgi:hypothetical protein
MKRVKYLLAVSIISIFIFSCGPQEQVRKKMVFVLCDVSNSTTAMNTGQPKLGMLDSLKSYVRRIPACYPHDTKIIFYPISANSKAAAIGEEIIYQNVEDANWKAQDSANIKKINTINQAIDSLAGICKNSCILNSIESIVSAVQDYKSNPDYKNYDFELIIISDLVESCGDTKISINAFDKESLQKSLVAFSSYEPRSNLGQAFQKVQVIMNVPFLADSNAVLIKNAWVALFSKMGLTEQKNLIIYQRVFTMQKLDFFN